MTTHSVELIDALLATCPSESELDDLTVFRLQMTRSRLNVSRLPGREVAFARAEIHDDLR